MKHPSLRRARASWLVPLVVAYGMVVSEQAQAELLMRFWQTGSSVTATLSGTINANWGSPNSNPAASAGGLPAGGYNASGVQFARGGAVIGLDVYTVVSPTISPSIAALTGTYLTDLSSSATPGGSTSYATFFLDSNVAQLTVPLGVTVVDAYWVWGGKQLSDFFFTGTPVLSTFGDFFNAPLGTLDIDVPEIDPAGFGSVAALVSGVFGLVERRRLRKSPRR